MKAIRISAYNNRLLEILKVMNCFSSTWNYLHLPIISYLERERSLWFFLRELLRYRGRLGNARRGRPGRSGGYRSGGTDCLGRTVPPGRWRRGRFNLTLQPAQPACLVKSTQSPPPNHHHQTPWCRVRLPHGQSSNYAQAHRVPKLIQKMARKSYRLIQQQLTWTTIARNIYVISNSEFYKKIYLVEIKLNYIYTCISRFSN